MRGKVLSFVHSQFRVRITPAYAGKSPRVAVSGKIQKDHPRLCGEKGNTELCGWVTGGSPPPMRGKVV